MSHVSDLDAAPRRPRSDRVWDEQLEVEFDRRLEKTARLQIVVVLGVILILTSLGLLSDANAGILTYALLVKLCFHIPALILGLVAARYLPLPANRVWLTGAIPLTVTVGVTMMLAIQSTPPITDRYAVIAGLATLASNVFLPIRSRVALALTAFNIAVFVGVPLLARPFEQVAPYLDILLFMSAITLATLILVYNRESIERHAFLMARLSGQQTVELQALVSELTQLAHRDPLTGAGNRRSFEMRYHATWRTAALRHEQIALLLIDVDHFKLFNDAAGHAEGDLCLKAVAEAIARGAGCSIDAVGRYGGEEFVLVLQSTTGRVAESIRSSVASLAIPHPGLGEGSIVTVSIGKAFAYPGAANANLERLVQAADEALYEAKRNGRNCVVMKGHLQLATVGMHRSNGAAA